MVAWYIGGPINDKTAPGVITAIFMSLGLLLATVWPFVEEVRARNHVERQPEEVRARNYAERQPEEAEPVEMDRTNGEEQRTKE